jgi:mannose-binding lectin 1
MNLFQAYENQADRELRMIFEGQNFIHQTLRELSKRFDELLGRQELVLSKVTQMSAGGVAVPQGGVNIFEYFIANMSFIILAL